MNHPPRDFNPAAAMAEMTDVVLEQIRKLADLHQSGILTEEEFTAKKAELLARI
ncbi:MAG TPA: SHOCT domain-containing protein [Sphingomicrobium sp.]|nr:SHOCT domain-containing protein [Sphingomicrobium sp.]